MATRYRVTLDEDERAKLQGLVGSGKSAARRLSHARILLKADQAPGGPAWTDPRIAEAVGRSAGTVARVRQRFVGQGLESALDRKPSSQTYLRKLDGRAEAHLIAVACGEPPEGRARWTLRLLADRVAAAGVVEGSSYETVRQTLKKTDLSLG